MLKLPGFPWVGYKEAGLDEFMPDLGAALVLKIWECIMVLLCTGRKKLS